MGSKNIKHIVFLVIGILLGIWLIYSGIGGIINKEMPVPSDYPYDPPNLRGRIAVSCGIFYIMAGLFFLVFVLIEITNLRRKK